MEYMDVLAKLGVGNAHPGGFSATINQLERYPLPAGSHVLEVGCGTGRTACYLAKQKQGYKVSAVDIRSDMLSKAKNRAEQENVNVQFIEGDACVLPFSQDSFDVVLVESVSIFADSPRAIAEYYRVLKTGGTLYDREVVRVKEMPVNVKERTSQFYNIKHLWSIEEWSGFLKAANFQRILIEGPHEFPKNMSQDLLEYPDLFQQTDVDYLFNPELWKLANEYDEIMERYNEYVGHSLIIGTK